LFHAGISSSFFVGSGVPGGAAELILIGAIGKSWYDDSGITEQEVRDAIKTIPNGNKINVRLNSEGGSVKEGLGIYNAFKERRDDITCYITGYALSIASVFPLGAGKVVSPKSAIWMMHKAWSWNQGNADETLIDIYSSETRKSKADIRSAMEKETWIKGADAVAFGLADETDTEDDASAAYRPLDASYLSRCKNISPEILNCLQKHSAAPANGGQPNKPQPQDQKMKKNIVALLTMHGILNSKKEAFTADSTDAEIESALETLAQSKDPTAKLAAIEAKLELAEENRIKDKILPFVADGRISNEEAATVWIPAAKHDLANVLALLGKKETVTAGGSPVGHGGNPGHDISVMDDHIFGMPTGVTGLRGIQMEKLVNIRAQHKTPQARKQAIKENYAALLNEAIAKDIKAGKVNEVRASNTYSGTLITSYLMDGSLTDLQNVWAFLGAYSIAKDTDPYKPLAVGVLKHVTAGESTQTDPTNFEPSGGSTVAPISVTTHWYNQPMRVSAIDLNSGLRMDDLRIINLANFSNKITEVATAPIVSATFTATPLIRSFAAFGFSDLATLQGQLQKSPIKNFIADGNYIARIANQPGFFQVTGQGLNDSMGYQAYGWNVIAPASDWTGAGANIKGFACNPQAIVRATGLPLNPPNIPGGTFSTSTFEIPGVGVACALSVWFSLASRTMFVSWDIIAGFASGDASAGVIVATGTPG